MIDKELLKKLKTMEVITRRRVNSLFAGEYHSAFKGRGIEFEEVRMYMPGDDIRDIDWNVSARCGDLYIKRFREERELTLYILIDLSASGNFGSGIKTRRENSSEIAALLGFSALSNNDKVGLIGFTNKVELFIPASKGRSHVMKLLQKVLTFNPRGTGTDISGAMRYLQKIQKRQAIVFILSDFIDTQYEKSLKSLSYKHDVLTLSLFDKREEQLPDAGLLRLRDPENGKEIFIDSSSKKVRRQWKELNRTYREEKARLHRKSGADHSDLDISGDWVKQLSRFFLQRQARGIL